MARPGNTLGNPVGRNPNLHAVAGGERGELFKGVPHCGSAHATRQTSERLFYIGSIFLIGKRFFSGKHSIKNLSNLCKGGRAVSLRNSTAHTHALSPTSGSRSAPGTQPPTSRGALSCTPPITGRVTCGRSCCTCSEGRCPVASSAHSATG